MEKYDAFLEAIKTKKIVNIKFDSFEKGVIERLCIPFDFGPSRRNLKDNPNRYHFYDLNSPDDGKHNLSILPEQLLDIQLQDQVFDPAVYIKWTPNWFISRDWGDYS